jgi:hypothetical protein
MTNPIERQSKPMPNSSLMSLESRECRETFIFTPSLSNIVGSLPDKFVVPQ